MASVRKGLVLSLGLVNVAVDLHAVMGTDKVAFRRLCGEHMEPLSTQTICPVDGKVVSVGEQVSGYKVANGYQVAPSDERPTFEAVDGLAFEPVPRKQLADHVVYGSGFYYCQPSNEAANLSWGILLSLAKEHALIAKGNLRKSSSEKLWSLEEYRGYLTMREVTFPDLIREPPDKPNVKIDRPTMALAKQYVAQVATTWDKVDSSNTGRDRLLEWVQSGTFVERVPGRIVDPGTIMNLTEALKRAVESTK